MKKENRKGEQIPLSLWLIGGGSGVLVALVFCGLGLSFVEHQAFS